MLAGILLKLGTYGFLRWSGVSDVVWMRLVWLASAKVQGGT